MRASGEDACGDGGADENGKLGHTKSEGVGDPCGKDHGIGDSSIKCTRI